MLYITHNNIESEGKGADIQFPCFFYSCHSKQDVSVKENTKGVVL